MGVSIFSLEGTHNKHLLELFLGNKQESKSQLTAPFQTNLPINNLDTFNHLNPGLVYVSPGSKIGDHWKLLYIRAITSRYYRLT